MTKYNIVSGWKRGGTSALMLALRQCGIPIMGFKYPISYTIKHKDGTLETEKDGGAFFPIKTREAKDKQDNPTGFWEIASLSVGSGLQEKWDGAGMDGDLAKIPFDHLTQTNEEMANKVIVILRNPLKVLDSQMKAGMLIDKENRIRTSALGMIYIAVQSIYWLAERKKNFYIMFYEDLLKNPKKELKRICEFFNRGDYKWGVRAIQKGLDRSKPLKRDYPELKELNAFYKGIRDEYRCEQYDLNVLRKRIEDLDTDNYFRFNETRE